MKIDTNMVKKGVKTVPVVIGFTTEIIVKYKEFRNSVNELKDKNNKEIEIDKDILKCNVRKLLHVMEKEYKKMGTEKEKNGITLKQASTLVLTITCPLVRCMTAGYAVYKTINKTKDFIQDKKDYNFNYKVFIKLYKELGLEEKMNDILYEPTLEELNILIKEYEIRTENNLIELLYHISNN